MMSLEYIRHINLLNDKTNRRDLFDSVSGDLESYTVDPDRVENWQIKTRDGTMIGVWSRFEPRHFHMHYHPTGEDDPGIGVCSDYDAIAHVISTIWTVIDQCSYNDTDDPDEIRDSLDTANRDLSQAFEHLTMLYGDPALLIADPLLGVSYVGPDDRQDGLNRLDNAINPVVAWQDITGDTDPDPLMLLLALLTE